MHVYGLFCSLQWHGQEGHDGVRAGTEFQKVRNLPGDSFKARRKQALLKVKRNVKDPQASGFKNWPHTHARNTVHRGPADLKIERN